METTKPGTATVVFARKVKPGHQKPYERWLSRVTNAATGFDGYQGTIILQPATEDEEYVAIVHFNTSANLEHWLNSKERRSCTEKLPEVGVESEVVSRLAGLEHWVSHTGKLKEPPPNWKMAILIFSGLYPVVSLQAVLLDPLLEPLPQPLGLLVSLVISVPIMVWIVLPFFLK
jgi:antibiotic biosynthesis monooxygenase (ABM) superfamily enzyme